MVIHARNFITPDRALGGIQIENSLRFEEDDTTYLEASPTFNTKKYTFSFWFKPVKKGGGVVLGYNMVGNNRHTYQYDDHEGHWANQLRKGGSTKSQYASSGAFRDFTGWQHVVFVWDTDNGTQNDRFIVYVNGVRAAMTQYTGTVSGETGYIGSGITLQIGKSTDNYSKGRYYLADYYLIDGQAYDATYFGYTDAQTGQWRPKKYTGSYGSGGFHLEFKDSSNLGKDTSGNSNNWTANNFSVSAGAGKDLVTDSPTNNFCVLNVTDRDSSVTVTDGGLKVSNNNQTWAGVKGTLAVNSGKWYYEMKCSDANIFCGWAADDLDTFIAHPQDDNNVMSAGSLVFCDNGKIHLDTGGSENRVNYSSALSANDVLGCAIDLDNDTAQFYKNGTALGSIDISSSKLAVKHVHPYFISYYTSQTYTFDFGQQGFVHTPPAGYRALNSKNIATPIPAGIVRPKRHFDTLLYTGNGSNGHVRTGLEFKPDLVWFKCRSTTHYHDLYDSVRGANKRLIPNSNSAENSYSNLVQSFNEDGVTLGTAQEMNQDSATYVAWCWKAGGSSTVSNTDGDQTTQVSLNEEAGFGIVTYTGTGSNTNIGHGLGAVPEMIITKSRSASGDWAVLDKFNTTAEYGFFLNDNGGYSSYQGGTFWNDTPPTSTVFRVSTNSATNASGVTYVAYCWKSIPGFSKIGKYTGNGNTRGTYVYLGFRPAWVMVKRTDTSSNWHIWDNKRDPDNPVYGQLNANLSNSEVTGDVRVDFLSNGFKHRNSNGGKAGNYSGGTYIYMAFAEQPGNTAFDTITSAR